MPAETLRDGPNPSGLCECGCGRQTLMARKDDARYGLIGGKPQRFVFGHQQRSRTPEYAVDEKTGCWNWLRAKNRTGYGIRGEGLAHRYSYQKAKGPIPKDAHLDHLCRNPSCVNPAHLRVATPAENAANRSAVGNNGSSSRYRGVHFDPRVGKWTAKVVVNYEAHYLGCYVSEDEAGAVAAAFRAEHMPGSSEFAVLGHRARKESA